MDQSVEAPVVPLADTLLRRHRGLLGPSPPSAPFRSHSEFSTSQLSSFPIWKGHRLCLAYWLILTRTALLEVPLPHVHVPSDYGGLICFRVSCALPVPGLREVPFLVQRFSTSICHECEAYPGTEKSCSGFKYRVNGHGSHHK